MCLHPVHTHSQASMPRISESIFVSDTACIPCYSILYMFGLLVPTLALPCDIHYSTRTRSFIAGLSVMFSVGGAHRLAAHVLRTMVVQDGPFLSTPLDILDYLYQMYANDTGRPFVAATIILLVQNCLIITKSPGLVRRSAVE